MCRSVIDQAKKGKIEIVTSALSLAEVCKNRDVKDGDPSKVASFFEHDYVLIASLDRVAGEKARELMMSGIFGLKPQDACHLAAAVISPNVVELHTFDKKLLDLDLKLERADRSMLKICKPDPSLGGNEPPLLQEMKKRDKPDG